MQTKTILCKHTLCVLHVYNYFFVIKVSLYKTIEILENCYYLLLHCSVKTYRVFRIQILIPFLRDARLMQLAEAYLFISVSFKSLIISNEVQQLKKIFNYNHRYLTSHRKLGDCLYCLYNIQ
jgi:hypothetical protein